MKKEDIIFSDWQRWLFGEAPPSFTGEVALRAFILFLFMVLLVRLLGRRMKGQFSVGELAVILTLGAMLAGPLQQPVSGLLPSMVVLLAVLGMHRLSNWLAYRYRSVELVQQGDLAVLVRDGVLDLEAMQRQAMSQEQLFGLLRNETISQLGELRRVYFEANGRLSVYKVPEPLPGLSVLPRADAPPAATQGQAQNKKACASCGTVPTSPNHAGGHCPRCGADDWTPAALQVKKEKE